MLLVEERDRLRANSGDAIPVGDQNFVRVSLVPILRTRRNVPRQQISAVAGESEISAIEADELAVAETVAHAVPAMSRRHALVVPTHQTVRAEATGKTDAPHRRTRFHLVQIVAGDFAFTAEAIPMDERRWAMRGTVVNGSPVSQQIFVGNAGGLAFTDEARQ